LDVPESFLDEHDNGFVINFQDDIPLFAEVLDKYSEGLSLLLYNMGQVPFDLCRVHVA
jgi:hypothetical protein